MNGDFARTLVSDLRLKDLQFIRRVAEHSSLSAAASDFGMTQPAASRWLRELEQLFRGHLFIRDRMVGMTPTPLGELVVQRGRALLADVESLSTAIDAHRSGRGGEIQLGVIPYVPTQLLESVVSSLVGEFDMTVNVVEAATEPLIEALRMERLHAVIGRCSGALMSEDLRQELLFTQKACLVVHAKSAVSRAPLDLSAAIRLRWVVPPTNSPTWQAITAALTSLKIGAPTTPVETASTKLVHALVAAHPDMAGIVPLNVGRDLEKLGGVRAVPFPDSFKMPPVGFLAHARHWDLPNIVALRNTVKASVAHPAKLT
jgi:DNA-binding transcriptional LysR family regulator